MATDPKFGTLSSGLDAPASGGTTITPSDVTVLSQPSRAVWVGVAGNLAVRMHDGTSLTFVGVSAGSLLPLRVDQVLSTGTTASSIVTIH